VKKLLYLLLSVFLTYGCSNSSGGSDQEGVNLPSTSTTEPSLSSTSTPSQVSTTVTSPPTTLATTTTTAPLAKCSEDGHGLPEYADPLSSHQIWIGQLEDTRIADSELLIEQASVADGLMIGDTIHIWWVAAEDHVIHHGTLEEDVFTDHGPITVDGEVFSGMVDPDVVLIDDSTIGLIVLDGFLRQGPPGPICYLTSNDGQNFSSQYALLDMEDRFDPSVVIIEETWWLAVGILSEENPKSEIFRKEPGGTFELITAVTGGVPDLSYQDGMFRLLTCSLDGMRHQVSSDGMIWEQLENIRTPGCDPSTITGSDYFLFKMQEGTLPPLD
jgi:hypothetical protein|tara:strand:+ start:620 stop:1606 length:987 start_codon:yes stop_codon:yes gene_type:complete